MDLYLLFADEAEANSILYTEVPTEFNEEGEPIAWTTQPNYQNIDTLGILYVEQDDPEAEPVPEEGWHINVRLVEGEDGEPLYPFEVHPVVPRRIWA